MKLTLYIVLILSLSSCGFNFMFLHPYKLEANSTVNYHPNNEDSLVLKFNEYAPTFYVKDNVIVDSSYTITSDFITNKKGDSLNVWWIDPTAGWNNKTIFFLHGNAANLAYQYQGMVPFVREGYRVYALDYSGFGFSQGKAKRKFLIDDAREAFDIFIQDSLASSGEIIVYGQSLGGHLSATIAHEFQENISLLVTEGAYASHKDVASDMAGILGRIFVKEGYSGKKAITEFEKPYLIVHSTDDKVVKYWHSEELAEHANENTQILTIDNCHICGPRYHFDTISSTMEHMLTKKGSLTGSLSK